ncbi:MAG: hypothetical protein SFU27_05915, partial [Thermonemataceae bacterium]|nr:hypothetical protein [Thermonemataceae bacterium]
MDLQSFCYLPHEVFEGRNQSYGAYELRKKYNKTVTIILFAVIAVAVTTFAYPTIKRMLEHKEEVKKETTIVEETVAIDLVEEEPEEEKPQEKQEVTIQVPPPPQVDQTKFTVIEVTPEKVEVIKENKEIEEKETAVATETKE